MANTFTIVRHFNTSTGVYEEKMLVMSKGTSSKTYINVDDDEILRIRMQETVVRMQAKLAASNNNK